MKNKTLVISSVCIAMLFGASLVASAATKKTASPTPSPAASTATSSGAATASASASPKAPRPIPFHGMVSAVDQTAKTFTIAGKEKSRVFKITDKTVVTKAGQPATMADITANVEIAGSYWKEADGSLEAKTVKVGPMGEKKETTKKEKASPAPAASPAASPKKP